MASTVFPVPSSSGNISNDFTVNVTSTTFTNVTLSGDFPAGTYLCTSSLTDTTLDIYFLASDGTNAGSASATTASTVITATKAFNRVVVYGATNADTLTFAFKYIFATTNITSNGTGAAPRAISLTPSSLPNQNNTTVITGQNFASDVTVTFTGSDALARSAKTIVRDSSTQLTVTRPDSMPPAYSPYTVTVANPGISSPASSNQHILASAITTGGVPVWSTGAVLPTATYNTAYSHQLSATDADNSTNLTYAIVSGSLPTGLTLSGTGLLSGTGTRTTGGGFSLVISATDSGGNSTNLSTSLPYAVATGGTITTDGTYIYHTFTANGTYTPLLSQSVTALAVGGGGNGAFGSSSNNAGGGGGGATLTTPSLTTTAYSVVVGGAGSTSTFNGSSAGGGSGGSGTTGGNSGTPQSNAGALGNGSYAGGGGGAGGVSSPGSSGYSAGGAGYSFNSKQYGAGGGGGGGQVGSAPGGGFAGPSTSSLNQNPAQYNYRGGDGEPFSGGGGGGGYNNNGGGTGATGTVVIRY